MAVWACAECTTAYAVGAPRCPHCGSENYTEDGMAKATVGGASDDKTAAGDAPQAAPAAADAPAEDDGEKAPKAITSKGSLKLPALGAGNS